MKFIKKEHPGPICDECDTEPMAHQALLDDVRALLIAWEQYKKSNWWESESIDVEKVLMESFSKIYSEHFS